MCPYIYIYIYIYTYMYIYIRVLFIRHAILPPNQKRLAHVQFNREVDPDLQRTGTYRPDQRGTTIINVGMYMYTRVCAYTHTRMSMFAQVRR